MEKTTKLMLRYHRGALPSDLGGMLQNADETDLRVLIGALMLSEAESGTFLPSELTDTLGMERTEVDASLKFWRGAGILTSAKGTGKTAKKEERKEKEEKTEPVSEVVPKRTTAHRNGVLEHSGTAGMYSSAELAALMEKRRVSAQFIDEAQRVMGKIFRTYDTGILVGIVDQLGFEEEAVLAILTYTAGRGKKTIRYAEQLALALYDEGITDTPAVLERIGKIERAGETIGKIRTLFGIGSRELTTTEKRLFTSWTEKMAYDMDVIRMAYEITVDNIGNPAPKYTNSILERWYGEGLRTAEEVRTYIERQNAQKNGTALKSYDVEDFFEAALQRSYEE